MFLSLILATLTVAAPYPPQDYLLEQSCDSPKHTFSVETWRKKSEGPDAALCLWIITPDKETAELLVPPGVLTPLYSPDVSIAPDEH